VVASAPHTLDDRGNAPHQLRIATASGIEERVDRATIDGTDDGNRVWHLAP
jgi:hypothetical protein